MDQTDSKIVFTENGCNHCEKYFKGIENRSSFIDDDQTNLRKVFDEIKGKTRKYNGLIGLSGGIDSSKTIILAHQYNLNLLVVHLNNGWNTEIADKNIRALLDYTNYDYIEITPNFQEFLEIQKAYIRSGVVNIEIPTDLSLKAVVYKTAKKHKIPFLFQGNNLASEGFMVSSWGHPNDDLRNMKDILRHHCSVKIKTVPIISYFTYAKLYNKIQRIEPLNYINYNPIEARKELEKEVKGWRDYGEKHYESLWTKFYQAYILPKKYNIDKRKMHYSSLVCAGILTREEALAKLQEPCYPESELKNELPIITEKFGLSANDFLNFIFEAPIRDHSFYKTDKFTRMFVTLIRKTKILGRKIKEMFH